MSATRRVFVRVGAYTGSKAVAIVVERPVSERVRAEDVRLVPETDDKMTATGIKKKTMKNSQAGQAMSDRGTRIRLRPAA